MRNRIGNIIWGLLFIAVGIGYGGEVLKLWDFKPFFDGWWTLFIIIPSVIEIIRKGFRVWSVAGFLIGGILLLICQDVIDREIAFGLIVPVILVIVGIRMIIPQKKIKNADDGYIYDDDPVQFVGGKNMHRYSATFTERRYVVDSSEVFEGCSVSATFGRFDLDLRAARIVNNVTIDVSSNFGWVTIRLPQNVCAEVDSVPFFGSVDENFYSNSEVGAPVVTIRANVAFGDVDID